MKAEIKSHMVTDDFFISPEKYVPNNIYDFRVNMTFSIGIEGKDGEEIFDIAISNKRYKKDIVCTIDNMIFSYGCIQTDCYDYEKVMKAIQKYIHTIKANNWNEITDELRKVFKWEFENYKLI